MVYLKRRYTFQLMVLLLLAVGGTDLKATQQQDDQSDINTQIPTKRQDETIVSRSSNQWISYEVVIAIGVIFIAYKSLHCIWKCYKRCCAEMLRLLRNTNAESYKTQEEKEQLMADIRFDCFLCNASAAFNTFVTVRTILNVLWVIQVK